MPSNLGWTIVAHKDGTDTYYPGLPTAQAAVDLGIQLVDNGEADSFTVRPSIPADWEKIQRDQE